MQCSDCAIYLVDLNPEGQYPFKMPSLISLCIVRNVPISKGGVWMIKISPNELLESRRASMNNFVRLPKQRKLQILTDSTLVTGMQLTPG